MRRKIWGAKVTPAILTATVHKRETSIACIPAREAASRFFSPTRLETIAVAAALRPIAIEYTKVMTLSVANSCYSILAEFADEKHINQREDTFKTKLQNHRNGK